jgi:hypothetical protein
MLCVPQVLRYLQVFTEHFQLQPLVRFSTQVVHAVPRPPPAATPLTPQLDTSTSTTQQQQQRQQPAQQQHHTANASQDVAAAAEQQQLPWQRWQVTWRQLQLGRSNPQQQHNNNNSKAAASLEQGVLQSEVFDALLVCNGHYTEPHLPQLPGAEHFPGLLMHSHNYRRADVFRGQTVAVIGASFSGLQLRGGEGRGGEGGGAVRT